MIKTKHINTVGLGEAPEKHLKEPYIRDFDVHTNKGYAKAIEEPEDPSAYSRPPLYVMRIGIFRGALLYTAVVIFNMYWCNRKPRYSSISTAQHYHTNNNHLSIPKSTNQQF
jgi:hypothetical protein